uniref:Uncharacterized protein n=1 Tax=Rhizophora mucronata TaxID=61149 RepID=A0A2P2Q2X7_RHIMU
MELKKFQLFRALWRARRMKKLIVVLKMMEDLTWTRRLMSS